MQYGKSYAAKSNVMRSSSTTHPNKAYAHLRESILKREYLPGQRLVAQEVATELGLSRTPVREALGLLEQHGLVEQTGWGFIVRQMTLGDIEDLFDAREIIELEVARKALTKADDEWVNQLRGIVARTRDHLAAGKPIESIRAARQLYVSVAERAGNKVLAQMLAGINDQIELVGGALVSRHPERADEILLENESIVDAIAQKNIEGAMAAIRDHIHKSRRLHLNTTSAILAA